jgi:hypothetical protein
MIETDLAACMETVARTLLGEPSSSSAHEWRYGTHGSLSINLTHGTWFDHETNEGGGVLGIIRRETACSDDREAVGWLERHGFKEASDTAFNGNGNGARRSGTSKASVPIALNNFRIVQTWNYTDENGAELFQVCRLENGVEADEKRCKRYLQRRRDPSAPGRLRQ